MKIIITSRTHKCKEYYEWELKDGPEEFESVKGYSTDLINAFTKILEWRERILKDYEVP
jgi:hypothetical protein